MALNTLVVEHQQQDAPICKNSLPSKRFSTSLVARLKSFPLKFLLAFADPPVDGSSVRLESTSAFTRTRKAWL